jgi:CRISPR/Cas system-associated exonuclease Cas4 (RecB family)
VNYGAISQLPPKRPLPVVPAMRVDQVVASIVGELQRHGYVAGMALARRYGLVWESGAKAYVDARTLSEPALVQRIADLRVLRTRTINVAPDVRLEFLEARLAQVRAAISKGHTPDPAVADKPDLPDDGSFPRWANWLAIGIAALGLAISISKSN